MLSNSIGTNYSRAEDNKELISEVPDGEESKPEDITGKENIKSEDEIINEKDQPISSELENGKVMNKPEVLEAKRDSENKSNKSQERKEAKTQDTRKDLYLNKQTKNTNILILGIAEKELEMISIYSINKNNKKSAGIFLPTRTCIQVNGEMLSFKEIYQKYGVTNLKKILGQCLEVDIPYHMVADKQGLVELSELIGPLYVENENIDIPNLFVRPVSDKDNAILQSLAEKVTQPKMILQVPKLIKIFIANVQSDIGVSGLWDLYSVFKELDHSEIAKTVLWGEKMQMADKEYWFIKPYDWHNVIYEMTM
jgi:anionic cell wall polymer biosynthesis LytR-Cps2A-Psr (LCP) family protein